MLVNGWTAAGTVWPARLVDRLERDHRVVRIDNRGTGIWRGASMPFTMPDLAADVRRMIDRLELDRAVVVGLSMGGMIAQELALRWPDKVGGLVLVGTRPPAPEYTPPAPAVLERIFSPPPPGTSPQDWVHEMWGTATAPGFVDGLEEMARLATDPMTPFRTVLGQARAVGAWHGADRLARLAVPTVVVHGDLDPLMPVRNGMRLAQLIPTTTYLELAGVGHLVPFEEPDMLAEIVEDLATDVSRRRRRHVPT